MGIREFSDEFEVLVHSYATRLPFGADTSFVNLAFDEYEKSVFLTHAQKDLALRLYTGKNPSGESFEETEEVRRYLSPLVAEAELQPTVGQSGKPIGISGDKNTRFFTLPEDLWFITYEGLVLSKGKCESHKTMQVVPVTQDEYHKIRKNPFRGSNDRRALRLDLADGVVEIVCKYEIDTYYVRYLKKLSPIVLVDLSEENSIDGVSEVMGCSLHEGLHQQILERAVEMAVRSRVGSVNGKVTDRSNH